MDMIFMVEKRVAHSRFARRRHRKHDPGSSARRRDRARAGDLGRKGRKAAIREHEHAALWKTISGQRGCLRLGQKDRPSLKMTIDSSQDM
jgi:hypothetical protein